MFRTGMTRGAYVRRPLCCSLTPGDRAIHSKWVRFVAAFYGCAALLFSLMAMMPADRSPFQPGGSAEIADLQLDAAVPLR